MATRLTVDLIDHLDRCGMGGGVVAIEHTDALDRLAERRNDAPIPSHHSGDKICARDTLTQRTFAWEIGETCFA
jgi:hypothetical protein